MTPQENKASRAAQRDLGADFERQGLTPEASRVAALAALNEAEAGGLEFHHSAAAIRTAAAARRFLTPDDIAGASGRLWKKVRRVMPRHLDQLSHWSHGQGWPLLGAVVVEKSHLRSGHLGQQALAGFTATARSLGVYRGGDALAFLAAEQARVFDWAARDC